MTGAVLGTCTGAGGGGQLHGSSDAGPHPHPPHWGSGQQLVAKGTSLRSPWAPKPPDAPHFWPLCIPTPSLTPTLTLTPTPTQSLVLALPLTLTRPEYWDRAGGESNITFKAFCDFRRAKIAYNGLKRAHFTCLCTPNGLVIILEKRIFDPFLTLFGPQKFPKRAKNTCLSTPSGLGTNLEKIILDHFWTHR